MCSGAFWSDANACLRGNCRTDGDCGPGGFCSPASEGPCAEGAGLVAYYCHTPQDECLDEDDCNGAGLCGYDEGLSRWTCQSDLCQLSAILP